jgi:hypothetical protein
MASCNPNRYCSTRSYGDDLDRDQLRLAIVFGVLENVIGFIGILIAVIVGILQARYFRHLNATTNDGWIEEAMPPVASRLGDTSS